MTDAPTYKIVRFYQREGMPRRTLAHGLSKEEAQAHCNDPETSSSTCKKATNVRRTKSVGPWFDGWEEER